MNTPVYALKKLSKIYSGPAENLVILREIDLEIEPGEYMAIVGASGSGKSTLLHILGALDSPSGGEAFFQGVSLADLNESQKAEFRNRDLGFVFQFHHLLPEFNARENVAMQAMIGGMSREKALLLADETLALVGLENRRENAVTTLSGGERQRAAIARAILKKPRVILADEPTGNLDEKTGRQIADLLLSLNRERGVTLVLVTHNLELAHRAGRVLELKQGRLEPVS